MQDGTFKLGKGRNETGNNSTSTFIAHSDNHVFYSHTEDHARITVKAMKARVTTEYLLTQLLKQFYLQDGATTCIYTKAKEKPPPKASVTDRSVDQMCVEPG